MPHMPTINFSTYQSPFTWRYGSEEMRQIWSEENKYRQWRRVWLALAQAQYQAGLLNKREIADLTKHVHQVDIAQILEIEKTTRHDLVAALKEFSQKAKIGGKKLHLGATSTDITDNADTLRIQAALILIQKQLKQLLKNFIIKIEKYAQVPCLGYTHLQPAVVTTVGYRLAFYAQNFWENYDRLVWTLGHLKGKGFKGAVGSMVGYEQLLKNTGLSWTQMEKMALKKLGLTAFTITNQTYPRYQDFEVVSLLALIAASSYKFATDVRILQAPFFGEWQEAFVKDQVGSSAMPHKKNPVTAENICSLARWMIAQPQILLENYLHSYLERTLDDSANRRIVIAETFLASDQILNATRELINKLKIRQSKVKFNLEQFVPFATAEQIIVSVVKKGADRQKAYATLKKLTLLAWEKVEQGLPNPLNHMYFQNKFIRQFLTENELKRLLTSKFSLEMAIDACKLLVRKIKRVIK